MRKVFKQNLALQGTHYAAFSDHVDHLKKDPRHELLAKCDGFPLLDIIQLRSVITEVQVQQVNGSTPFPDPCGLELAYGREDSVRSGEVLARIRCENELWPSIRTQILECFRYSSSQPFTPFFEVISDS